MSYTGIQDLVLNQEQMAQFYQGEICPTLLENQYLLIRDEESGNVVDYFQNRNGNLIRLSFPSFQSDFCGTLKPRNPEQFCAFHLIQADIPIKLISGKFGVGKSLLMIAGALEALQKNKFEKIIFVRNNVQVKDTDPLGALPGLF